MNIAAIAKAKTVRADFRVCCNHKDNRRACIRTIDVLRRNFNNIVEINATRPHGTEEDMCVIGTAVIRPSMRSQFEKDLKDKINRAGPVKITKSIVTLPQ